MKIFLVLLLLTGFSAVSLGQSVRSEINTGNKKYEEENYDEAKNRYQNALLGYGF